MFAMLRNLHRNSTALACLAIALAAANAGGQTRDEDFSESLARAAAGERRAEERGALDAAEVARLIVQQTNEFREAEGRSPVATNGQLAEAARYFAGYMARTDRYGHTADGQRPAQRAREHGYELCIVSENIGYQFSTRGFATEELAQRFVQGWKDSPEHRRNMLDPDLTEIGVAIAQSEETDHFYAVQKFGRPRDLSIELQVENRSDADVEYELAERRFSLPPRYIRTHQQCRPAELTFHLPLPDAEEPRAADAGRIESDASFVVVRDQQGQLQVQRRQAEPAAEGAAPATR